MKTQGTIDWIGIAIVVLAHFVISIAHGIAHTNAQVPLSTAAAFFVYAVILAGPWIGLILMWRAPRAGAWLIALTLAGALVFGIINHFVLNSPDHYSHVSPEWRSLFTSTALLLAITEALGSGLAIRSFNRRRFL
jgi:hypothetical protein